jgi:antirestriction protein ArdC
LNNKVYEMVTERIVKELERGVIPWARPWVDGGPPVSWATQQVYRGINRLLPPGEYATFLQVQQAGGKVNKGERAHMVVFWKWTEAEDAETRERKTIPFLRYYSVFEVSTQCTGIEPKRTRTRFDHDPVVEAEAILAGYVDKPPVRFGRGRAFYSPSEDYISLPPIGDFPVVAEYYASLFHELAHSTGHGSRLNRPSVAEPGKAAFGSELYGKEELVAELAAAFLMADAGMDREIKNRASYIGGWLGAIKQDVRLIVSAAALATKATEYIRGQRNPERDADRDGEGLEPPETVVHAAEECGSQTSTVALPAKKRGRSTVDR